MNKRFCIAVFLLIAGASSWIAARHGGDFDVYLDASHKLMKGENIYQPPFIRDQYFYSVFFALLFVPFSNYAVATAFVWLLLSWGLLLRSAILIGRYMDTGVLTIRQKRMWIMLSVFLSLQFVVYNVTMIQVTFFMLWAMLEALELLRKEKPVLAGLLLGLVINIKIMPVLLLPYLFYRGQFKALAAALIGFCVLLYVPALFIGMEMNHFLLSEWWKVINPGSGSGAFETMNGMHSIVAVLPVYLTETQGELAIKRNFVNLSYATVKLLIVIFQVFFLALSLFFLRTKPFKKENNPLKLLWESSFFLLLIPLLMPHQQKYNFLLVLPMITYILYFFIRSYPVMKQSRFYKTVLIFFCINAFFYSPFYGSDIIGRHLFELGQHYRLLTFATIFLVPVALYSNPCKLAERENSSPRRMN